MNVSRSATLGLLFGFGGSLIILLCITLWSQQFRDVYIGLGLFLLVALGIGLSFVMSRNGTIPDRIVAGLVFGAIVGTCFFIAESHIQRRTAANWLRRNAVQPKISATATESEHQNWVFLPVWMSSGAICGAVLVAVGREIALMAHRGPPYK